MTHARNEGGIAVDEAEMVSVSNDGSDGRVALGRWEGAVLAAIVLLGALLRLGVCFWFTSLAPRIDDEREYDMIATNLVRGEGFAVSPGRPTSIRPPLFPFLVAGVYEVVGIGNHSAVRVVQVILGIATVLVVFQLGRLVAGSEVGLLTAGLVALYPSFLGFSGLILTEVLFTLLLCSFCLAVIHALRGDSLGWLAISGLVLGLATLARSAFWPFPVLLGLYLLWAWRGSFRRRLAAALIPTLTFAITITPWAIRNSRLERTFMTIDSMGGRNVMMGNYEYTPMFRAWDAISEQGERSWDQVVLRADPSFAGMTQGQKDKRALRYGLDFMASHPSLTLKRDIVKFFHFWGLERELVAGYARGYFGPASRWGLLALTLLLFGSYVFVMTTGFFGLTLVPPGDRRILVFLLLVIAFLCGIHTLTFGHSRYHLPILPLVMIFSSLAIVHWRRILASRGSWAFRLAMILCLMFGAAWMIEIVVVDGQRFLDAMRGSA
jgi:4-amino-4-deoxy-L-arabinose transferase-like glycosyltransferase